MASSSQSAADVDTSTNHYKTLGIRPDADDTTIRAAYRRCALVTHPDKGGSTDSFCAVCTAFETLSCRARRKAYDLKLQKEISKAAAGKGRRKSKASGSGSQVLTAREERLLDLEIFISATPKEDRRAILSGLPGRVRQALLTWMQMQQAEGQGDVTAAGASDEAPAQAQSRSDSASDSDSEVLSREVVACPIDAQSGKVEHRDPGQPQRGIKRAGGNSKLYVVALNCLNLQISSRNVGTLEEAIEIHTVFVLIRNALTQRQAENEQASPAELRNVINDAVNTCCEIVGVTSSTLGIALTPWISVEREVGRKFGKITGRKTHNFGAALLQRAEMLAAKEQGWSALRSVWIKILTKTRSVNEAESFVDAAYKSQAVHRAMTAKRTDNVSSKTKEERQSQKLATLVYQLEKAIDAEEQQAESARRREVMAQGKRGREEKRRRAEMRRWAADPSRTTEELLSGPPPELCRFE